MPSRRALPKLERQQMLHNFLTVLEEHPDLAAFRAAVPNGPARQLALFAAMERHVFRGTRLVAPPKADDQIDQWLCDILEVIDSDRHLKEYGSYHGANRHRVNLQALGVWTGEPRAAELFATTISDVSADAAEGSPACEVNLSPSPQGCSPNCELIGREDEVLRSAVELSGSAQVEVSVSVTADSADVRPVAEGSAERGIIRHEGQNRGEEIADSDGLNIPIRSLRRGRPPALDDMAKGRLLGLMAYGLSFRQAAAQLGVHHQTLLNAMKRDEQFAQQVAEARLDAISQPLLTVVKASRTSWRAAAWLANYLNERRLSTYETTPEEYELAKRRS